MTVYGLRLPLTTVFWVPAVGTSATLGREIWGSAFPPLPGKLPSGQSAVALYLPASDPVAGNCFVHPVLVFLVAPNNQQLACLWYEQLV